MSENATKKCTRCREIKPLSDFVRVRYGTERYGNPEFVERIECNQCFKLNNEPRREQDKKRYAGEKTNRLNNHQKRMLKRPRYAWANGSLQNHRVRGMKTEISIAELEEMSIGVEYCGLCGCKLDWSAKGKVKNDSPTVDRVFSEMVLRKDNIMIVCHRCNLTKGDRTLDEFISYCKHILEAHMQ